jgi:hypothetical protein
MNTSKAVILKIISTFIFAVMGAVIRHVGSRVPVGEIVFFGHFSL